MVPLNKKLLLTVLSWLLLGVSVSFAQQPIINSLSKTSGAFGETINILGSGFGTSASNIVVHFGSVKGNLVSVENTFIEVRVPAGATYSPVSVTNTTNGNTAYSSEQFLLSFGGDNGIEQSDFEGPYLNDTDDDLGNGSGLNDFCICDTNGNGKSDIISTSSSRIVRHNNTSTVNNFNFTKKTINIPETVNITCGDLDGDGLNDLVVANSAAANPNQFLIFKNSAGDFNPTDVSTITIPNVDLRARRIIINDVDNDGKPDIIASALGSNSVFIFRNQSTGPGNINFLDDNDAVQVTFPDIPSSGNGSSTFGLQVEDLNQDGRPEIITNAFSSNNSIFIATNSSTPGNIQFNNIVKLGNTRIYSLVRAGDLDGDGKADIAATIFASSGNGRLELYRNTSSVGGVPTFADPVTPSAVRNAWGLDLGDFDGDGKSDIAVGSVDTGSVTVGLLNNRSTPGTISFNDALKYPVNFVSRNIKIGDLNGDAKPEVIIASVDDNSSSPNIPASKISILKNIACLVPTISPGGAETICEGSLPVRLSVNAAGGAIYTWKKDGVTVKENDEAFFDAAEAGTYTVVATSDGGNCVVTSTNSYVLTVPAGSAAVSVTASSNSPVCIGSSLQLSVSPSIANATYHWTGPDGYAYSGTANPAPSITNFTQSLAGRYEVDVEVNGCVAGSSSVIVSSRSINVPSLAIGAPDGTVFCENNATRLTLPDGLFSYQWLKNGEPIVGAEDSEFFARVSGEYSANVVVVAGCSEIPADNSLTITVLDQPVAKFEVRDLACTEQSVDFTNTSTVNDLGNPTYLWSFGDENFSTDKDPTHEYANQRFYNVRLQVTYDDATCTNQYSKTIEIVNPPDVDIFNPDGQAGICEDGDFTLKVREVFDSYEWDTGETTQSIVVSEPGTYSVFISNDGCITSNSFTLSELPAPIISISADPEVIDKGESSQLNASGLNNYIWSPDIDLDNPNIANPLATPLLTETFIVTGIGDNGCTGRDSITVEVRGTSINDLIAPMNFFSPNGDNVNQFWEIQSIDRFPQCSVTVYDQNGTKVYEAKPYLNDWDGNYNGKDLPSGAYYYVIDCEGEGSTKTGSITLIR